MNYKAHITRPEDQVNNMDITQISRIDTAKFFESDNLKELNSLLIDICKHIFIEAYNNNGKETGAVLNIDKITYEYETRLMYNKINFNDLETLNKSKDYSCITIHTHNNISIFSIQDIKNLLEDNRVIAIILVNSVGNIYILCKDASKDYTELIDFLYEQINDFITPDVYKELNKYNLNIRRITT